MKFRRVDCLLDPWATWADPGHRTANMLRYQQVAFDLAESCRRRMQHNLSAGLTTDPAMALATARPGLEARRDQFHQDTRMGKDSLMVERWAAKLKGELEASAQEPGQELIPGKWSYGMHGVLGYGFFGGGLEKHLSGHFNVGYGFDIGYRRATLLLAAILSGTRVLEPMSAEERWPPDQRLGLAILDLSAGYVLVDQKKFRITPTLGIGLHALSSQAKAGNQQAAVQHSSWNIMYGLTTEMKIRKVLNLAEPSVFVGKPTYTETLLRVRLFGADSDFGADARGFSPGFSVGICWTGRFLNPKIAERP